MKKTKCKNCYNEFWKKNNEVFCSEKCSEEFNEFLKKHLKDVKKTNKKKIKTIKQ